MTRTILIVAMTALLVGFSLLAPALLPTFDDYPEPERGTWQAVAGDRLQLGEVTVRLRGLTCPTPDTSKGAAALAALKTFLADSVAQCDFLSSDLAACSVAGRDLTEAMQAAGYCP